MNKNVAKSIKSVLANMALLVFCLIYLSPIYIIVVNSFKSRAEMYTNVLALPETLTWEYYAGAVQRMDFINVFKNSIIVTLCSVVVIVVLCAMAAWMLVRTHTRLSRFLYSFLIVTMLIPFQTVMMPLMQEMNSLTKTLGIPMKNSLGGLVLARAWVCFCSTGLSNRRFPSRWRRQPSLTDAISGRCSGASYSPSSSPPRSR